MKLERTHLKKLEGIIEEKKLAQTKLNIQTHRATGKNPSPKTEVDPDILDLVITFDQKKYLIIAPVLTGLDTRSFDELYGLSKPYLQLDPNNPRKPVEPTPHRDYDKISKLCQENELILVDSFSNITLVD